MSVICDALLFISKGRQGDIEKVNEAINDEARGQGFERLDMQGAGGSKFFSGEVWAAAFNHVTPSRVEDAVASVDWADPEGVVLVLDPYDYNEPVTHRTVNQIRKEIA
jgi:hypothetical protein